MKILNYFCIPVTTKFIKNSLFFNFDSITKIHRKIQFLRVNNLYTFYFFSLFLQNGKKFKSALLIFSFFKMFFLLFSKNSLKQKKNAPISNCFNYQSELHSVLQNNLFLFNFLSLLQWYLNFFFFIFALRIKQVTKTKIKSITENKYDLKYVPKLKRHFFFFKWLKFSINNNEKKINFLRIRTILLDLFLNFKESKLYYYKIQLYKKILIK